MVGDFDKIHVVDLALTIMHPNEIAVLNMY
jgi:hypothetical protein